MEEGLICVFENCVLEREMEWNGGERERWGGIYVLSA